MDVLSRSNTPAEMARKRREYFAAGVRLVWEVDLVSRTVAIFDAPEHSTVLDESRVLDGGEVLPASPCPWPIYSGNWTDKASESSGSLECRFFCRSATPASAAAAARRNRARSRWLLILSG